jgi:hypothetical protein
MTERPCDPSDPEIERIAELFAKSDFDFLGLVKNMVQSPIITFSTRTKTGEEQGTSTAVAEMNRFCERLEARLDIADPCDVRGQSALRFAVRAAASLAQGLAVSAHGRGETRPVVPVDPMLFSTAAAEAFCDRIGINVVDRNDHPLRRFNPDALDASIKTIVVDVMGLPPSDPRHQGVYDLLTAHYAQAAAVQGVNRVQALRSTFTVACASPLLTGVGL